MELSRFNIRVYGIWVHSSHGVLVSYEMVDDLNVVKFPGGGLEFGEGPKDCIRREWQEELGFDIDIVRQFYFTDQLVPSFRKDGDQVVSLYYRVKPTSDIHWVITPGGALHLPGNSGEQFRFLSIRSLTPGIFTFPIDQRVAELLINGH